MKYYLRIKQFCNFFFRNKLIYGSKKLLFLKYDKVLLHLIIKYEEKIVLIFFINKFIAKSVSNKNKNIEFTILIFFSCINKSNETYVNIYRVKKSSKRLYHVNKAIINTE